MTVLRRAAFPFGWVMSEIAWLRQLCDLWGRFIDPVVSDRFPPSPQLFKPFLDLNPGVVVDVAMLTVRAVDSQEGE
jgi:hypothetical protein